MCVIGARDICNQRHDDDLILLLARYVHSLFCQDDLSIIWVRLWSVRRHDDDCVGTTGMIATID